MIDKNIDEIQPGATLAASVNSTSGSLLLEAGAQLSRKHLLMLKAHGIKQVRILDTLGQTGENSLPLAASLDQQPHLLELFRHNNVNHPFIKTLIRLCELRVGHPSTGACRHDS